MDILLIICTIELIALILYIRYAEIYFLWSLILFALYFGTKYFYNDDEITGELNAKRLPIVDRPKGGQLS